MILHFIFRFAQHANIQMHLRERFLQKSHGVPTGAATSDFKLLIIGPVIRCPPSCSLKPEDAIFVVNMFNASLQDDWLFYLVPSF